jgi:heme oxygenase
MLRKEFQGISAMEVDMVDSSLPISVVKALYLRTKTLHVEAERTGIIRDLLRGEADLEGYTLLLRNLLPAYRALEQGLERHRDSKGLRQIANFRLKRAPAIESDLVAICGKRWSHDLPLLDVGKLYASQIAKAAEGDGARLIAHAYTRYLGDLSGGRILQRLLARSLKLRPSELSFYDFPLFSDLDALKADYRKALDQAGAHAPNGDAIVEEGAVAFSQNIALSCAIKSIRSRGIGGSHREAENLFRQ